MKPILVAVIFFGMVATAAAETTPSILSNVSSTPLNQREMAEIKGTGGTGFSFLAQTITHPDGTASTIIQEIQEDGQIKTTTFNGPVNYVYYGDNLMVNFMSKTLSTK